jgi:poly(3-hydroxybutyrate) depolymerase
MAMLYQAYQAHSDLLSPLRLLAQHQGAQLWFQRTEGTLLRKIAAASEVISRLRLTHSRPAYGIDAVTVLGESVPVVEEETLILAFGTLLRFRKPGVAGQPPVLLVAPLSGHFATLLREGPFALDDYIEHMMKFLAAIGPGVHAVAVCQPCVAALAAAALMAEDDHPAQPRSLTLMAGPVDCRVNPTGVNKLATSKPIAWFEQNLINHVPLPHAGFMRRVYPGFIQLSAFLSMNLDRH